jgi:hypothetical protein
MWACSPWKPRPSTTLAHTGGQRARCGRGWGWLGSPLLPAAAPPPCPLPRRPQRRQRWHHSTAGRAAQRSRPGPASPVPLSWVPCPLAAAAAAAAAGRGQPALASWGQVRSWRRWWKRGAVVGTAGPQGPRRAGHPDGPRRRWRRTTPVRLWPAVGDTSRSRVWEAPRAVAARTTSHSHSRCRFAGECVSRSRGQVWGFGWFGKSGSGCVSKGGGGNAWPIVGSGQGRGTQASRRWKRAVRLPR